MINYCVYYVYYYHYYDCYGCFPAAGHGEDARQPLHAHVPRALGADEHDGGRASCVMCHVSCIMCHVSCISLSIYIYIHTYIIS